MTAERMRCFGNAGTCGALEGNLHRLGCDMERCSQCNGQYLYCDCPEPRQKRPRARFIEFPVLCDKCGTLWPEFFNVPDNVWRHYILTLGDGEKLICIDCWELIIKVIDKGAFAKKHGGAIMLSEIKPDAPLGSEARARWDARAAMPEHLRELPPSETES